MTAWWLRSLGTTIAALALTLLCAAPAAAQLDPSHHWRTIQTRHFYVHFTPPVEGLARRIAGDAERAYAQLSQELHPPRGMIDVVVSDDADFSNGSATPFPTNRIVVYANPPVSESALRYTNDWAQLVITHELTHIFHLDRVRGIWALGQHVFGRAETTFPNMYAPGWITEGLAVYEESRLTGAGRVTGSEHRMIARAAAIDHHFPALGSVSEAQGRFPFGEIAYVYGSLFFDYMSRSRGPDRVRQFVEKESADLIPYLFDIPARQGFGVSFTHAWREFRDSIARSVRVPDVAPLEGWRPLTHDGVFVYDPRWLNDSTVIYSGSPGRESFGAFAVDMNGRRTRVGRRNSRSPNVPFGSNTLLYSQLDFTSPYQQRSDLWIQRGTHERQLTVGQRLSNPDARADGRIVAEQILPGATRLVLVSRDGKQITPLTTGSYDEQWTEPHWSHAGDRIVASRWLRGNISQIVVLDTTGRLLRVVSSGTSIEATPGWLANDAGIIYSSDRTGATQLYAERYADPRTFAGAATTVLSKAETGLFEPSPAPGGGELASVLFRSDGYHLGVAPCCAAGGSPVPAYDDTVPAAGVAPVVVDSSPARDYSPWRTFIPRYWLPTVDQGIDGGYRIGAMTSGIDVVGRHALSATVEFPTNNTGIVWNGAYQYSGLGLPIIQADASQEWESLGDAFSRDAPRTILGEVFRRTLNGELLATWVRQRYRTATSLTGGIGLERRTHSTSPSFPIGLIDTTGSLRSLNFPTALVGASFTNYQFPPYAISPEDGVQVSATLRDRFRSGVNASGGQSLSLVSVANAYKSLDLPGFAHHVIALRGAAGWSDERASGYFSVGGISGSTFEIIPGYTVGEGRRTFGVRGFAPGTLVGIRAFTGSAEYRVPLLLTGGAPGPLPFFLDRSSLTLFGDYGIAWCPSARPNREVCNDPTLVRHMDIGSVGAELNLNLGLLSWDSPYRFRLGLVHPTQNGNFFGESMLQFYVTAGVSF